MSPTLLEAPMAKKKAVPTIQVRVAKDVAELAAIVAAYHRTQTSDLLTDLLRPILQRMHAEEIARAAGQPPRPAGPGPKKGGK